MNDKIDRIDKNRPILVNRSRLPSLNLCSIVDGYFTIKATRKVIVAGR